MKQFLSLFALLSIALLVSCSKDDEVSPNKIQHVGEKWMITSVEYNIVDQGLSNPANWVKSGTANNAGAFYFNGSEGSFDIVIEGDREEDYFGYTIDGASVSIITVDQSFSPSKFSQSVISLSGDKAETTMTLNGTFTRQSGMGQYVFTGTFVLTK